LFFLPWWLTEAPPRLSGDLTGSVHDWNGVPAAGAHIVLVYTCDSCPNPHEQRSEVVAGALGAFRIHEPVSHPALLTAFDRGLVSKPVSLFTEVDAPAEIDVCLLPEARITGTLLDADGRPLSGREVVAWPPSRIRQTTQTDGHGTFEFRTLPPGRTELTVEPTAREIAAAAGEDVSWKEEHALRRALDVDLGEGTTVEVRIPPAPVRLVWVRARVFENGVEQVRTIDAARVDNEAISAFGLCPEHDFNCLKLGPGLHRFSTWARLGDQRIPWSTVVEVPDAATFDYDLHIHFVYLHGTVHTSEGEPVADAELFWLPDDGQAYESSWSLGTTLGDGSFVRHVPAQGQRLCARFGERLSAWTFVRPAPDQPATVKLLIPGE